MQFRNSADSYGIIAQLFHWLIAALVFAQLAIGIYASDLPVSMERLQWLSRHKSIGFLLFVLVIARLAWRFMNRPPALPATLPAGERTTAVVTHRLLYVLLIAAPLSGWLHASAAGLGVNPFGWFALPDLVEKNSARAEVFETLHAIIVYLLAGLVALHVAAAVRHATLKDGLFQRMLPWNLTRKSR